MLGIIFTKLCCLKSQTLKAQLQQHQEEEEEEEEEDRAVMIRQECFY